MDYPTRQSDQSVYDTALTWFFAVGEWESGAGENHRPGRHKDQNPPDGSFVVRPTGSHDVCRSFC